MSHSLTRHQAYLAMYAFLDAYYQRCKSDGLAGLMSDISLLPDGSSADPAMLSDWAEAVEKALAGQVDARLQWQSRIADEGATAQDSQPPTV